MLPSWWRGAGGKGQKFENLGGGGAGSRRLSRAQQAGGKWGVCGARTIRPIPLSPPTKGDVAPLTVLPPIPPSRHKFRRLGLGARVVGSEAAHRDGEEGAARDKPNVCGDGGEGAGGKGIEGFRLVAAAMDMRASRVRRRRGARVKGGEGGQVQGQG
jgi:hypothetical protein